jgi:hypothetical protein
VIEIREKTWRECGCGKYLRREGERVGRFERDN